MKKRTLVGALLLISSSGFAAESKSVRDLGWLTGSWKFVSPTIEEEAQFSNANGGLILGTNRRLKNGAVEFAEFIQLKDDPTQTVFLNPNPLELLNQGSSGATFWLKEMSPNRVVFELEGHVFPTRITYEITPALELKTTVEGTKYGEPVKLESTLTRQ